MLGPCHQEAGLLKYAVGLFRFVAADLEEFQERVFPGISLGGDLGEGNSKKSASEEETPSPEEEERPKKKEKPRSGEAKPKESRKRKKGSEEPQKNEKKRRRHRSPRQSSERSESKPRPKNPGGAASGSRPAKSKRIKEEPSETVLDKSPLQSVVGEVSPGESEVEAAEEDRRRPARAAPPEVGVRTSRPRPEEERSPVRRVRSRSLSRDQPIRPPGRWTLSERPPEPACPPRLFRPPEPPAPPPGWVRRPGPVPSSRSKGATRRERNADIFLFGPSIERKRQREQRRSG